MSLYKQYIKIIYDNKRLLFIITVVFLCVYKPYAQPNQHADFQRAIAEKRSSASYLEKIEAQARTPNTPYRPSGVDTRQFYNNQASTLKPMTPEQQRLLSQYEANEKSKAAALSSQQSQKWEGMAPFLAQFRIVGFYEVEAIHNARQMTSDYGIPNMEYFNYHRPAVSAKAYFDEIKDTASFDLVMVAISEFERSAPASAYFALQGLIKRFPEYAAQIDEASIVNLHKYFKEYTLIIWDRNDSVQIPLCEEYFRLKEKYLSMEKAFIQQLGGTNPYKIMESKYQWLMGGEKFKSGKWKKLEKQRDFYYDGYVGAMKR